MDWRTKRPLGDTGLEVAGYTFGSTAIGGRHVYDDVTEPAAIAAVHQAHESGVRAFDTAPFYGLGQSEVRLGKALASLSRDDLIVSSKVGRTLSPADRDSVCRPEAVVEAAFDYGFDAARRQIEDSLARMQLDRLDIVFVHDPEWEPVSADEAKRGSFPALKHLKEQGIIRAIGVGLGDIDVALDLVNTCEIDVVMIACRYTLLEQPALRTLLPTCKRRNVAVFLAAPFNSGILATGSAHHAPRYNHHTAPSEIVGKVRAIEDVGRRHGVPLRAAALQFPLHNDAISTVVVGSRSASEVRDNLSSLEHPIPPDYWRELVTLGHLDPEVPLPSGAARV